MAVDQAWKVLKRLASEDTAKGAAEALAQARTTWLRLHLRQLHRGFERSCGRVRRKGASDGDGQRYREAQPAGRTSTLRDDMSGLACMSATKRRRLCAASADAGSGAPESGCTPKPAGAKNACVEDRAMSRTQFKLYASSAMKTALLAHDTPMASDGKLFARAPGPRCRYGALLSAYASNRLVQYATIRRVSL